jgi:hypothetical protein
LAAFCQAGFSGGFHVEMKASTGGKKDQKRFKKVDQTGSCSRIKSPFGNEMR